RSTKRYGEDYQPHATGVHEPGHLYWRMGLAGHIVRSAGVAEHAPMGLRDHRLCRIRGLGNTIPALGNHQLADLALPGLDGPQCKDAAPVHADSASKHCHERHRGDDLGFLLSASAAAPSSDALLAETWLSSASRVYRQHGHLLVRIWPVSRHQLLPALPRA